MAWLKRLLEIAGFTVRDNAYIQAHLEKLDRKATEKIAQIHLFGEMSETELLANTGKLVMHISLAGDYADFLGSMLARAASFTDRAMVESFGHLTGSQAVLMIEEIQLRLRAAEHEGRKILRKADALRGAKGALSTIGEDTAKARWARLDRVKDWAFQQRRDNPQGSRAAFIGERIETIRKMAKDAGEALSGDDEAVKATIARWFREAGIK